MASRVSLKVTMLLAAVLLSTVFSGVFLALFRMDQSFVGSPLIISLTGILFSSQAIVRGIAGNLRMRIGQTAESLAERQRQFKPTLVYGLVLLATSSIIMTGIAFLGLYFVTEHNFIAATVLLAIDIIFGGLFLWQVWKFKRKIEQLTNQCGDLAAKAKPTLWPAVRLVAPGTAMAAFVLMAVYFYVTSQHLLLSVAALGGGVAMVPLLVSISNKVEKEFPMA
ncbi:MAG: hypothetical protein AB1644_04915 [Candidatus Zixiibacteriota bacterium]